MKNVGSARLYRPAAGQDEKWPHLAPVLSTKTIDWDLIRQQYDQIVKYTTAPRLGTAEAEQVLRRFTRGGPSARSRNSGGQCVRRSSATTSPTPTCAARSTTGSRSWRTGTPPTTTCSTARTAT
nr:Tn3 family transposase [Streptomyces sp. QHH-9511]